MNINIVRPRGKSVIVELGAAIEVIKKYQAAMTLGYNWSKSRISCWKEFEQLRVDPTPAKSDFEVEFDQPAALYNAIGLKIQRWVEHRRYLKTAQYNQNIQNIIGAETQIKTLPESYRNGTRQPNVGRCVKIELLMSPYDVTNFAREMAALVKKYNRNTVRRGWAPKTPQEITQRYLAKYKTS